MADINVEEVLKKLTLAEKVDLLAGERLSLSLPKAVVLRDSAGSRLT
jgi:hypothetical protein